MNRILVIAVLTLATSSLSFGQTTVQQTGQGQTTDSQSARAGQQSDDVKQELMNLYREWWVARKRGDTDTMSRLAADEHILIRADGIVIDKARSLEAARSGMWKDSGDDPFVGGKDVTVHVYGDTAVMRVFGKKKGDTQTTLVWVRRQGRWVRVATHQSVIEQADQQQTPQPTQTRP